jgi:hypothetical protein
MATSSPVKSIFRIVSPGLVYSKRVGYPVDTADVGTPDSDTFVIEGEYLFLKNGKLAFPGSSANRSFTSADALCFPVMSGFPRLDVQSNEGVVTVLHDVGAIVQNSIFATQDDNGAITYAAGDNLVPAWILDPDAGREVTINGDTRKVRLGVCKYGSTPITTNPTAKGDLVAIAGSSVVVGVVTRPPFLPAGLGVGSGFSVLEYIVR